MRILIISPVFPPHKHGIGDYTFFLGNSWAEKGHKVIVLTDTNCKAEDNKKTLVKLCNDVTNWSIWNVFRIFHQVLRIKPHFISIQYESGSYNEKTAINWLPLLCKMFCREIPVLTTFHAFHGPATLSKLNLAMLSFFSDRLIVTNSEDYGKIERQAKFWLKKTSRIPIGANLDYIQMRKPARDKLRQKWGLREDGFILCFFGFILPDKGLDTIINAVKQLKEKGRKVKLLIVGGNPLTNREVSIRLEKNLKQQIVEDNLSDEVIMTGYLERSEVSQLLQLSHLGVILFEDGVSLRRGSLMAAITHFLPLITTYNRSPLPEYIKDGENIILTSYNNEEELAAKIAFYMDNPEKLADMRISLREIASEFDWNSIADKQIEAYNQLLRPIDIS